MRRIGTAAGIWLVAAIGFAQSPGSAPGYEHDRWVTQPTDIVREFEAFTVSFDSDDDDTGDGDADIYRIPEWVAYEIKEFSGSVPSYKRPDWFTDDDLFDDGIAPHDDSYLGEGDRWERGHMCMKNHAARISREADKNTHTLLNAAPQSPLLNKKIWRNLEDKTAKWANKYKRVWIVCGPIIRNGRPRMWIGDEDAGELPVAVPNAFFKIVIRESEDSDRPHVLAFIYPNSESERVLPPRKPYNHSKFQKTVDEVERQTGIDFLTALDNDDENAVESVKAALDWY